MKCTFVVPNRCKAVYCCHIIAFNSLMMAFKPKHVGAN
jgi:hypothetical protein